MISSEFFVSSQPVAAVRAVHLDLKGVPPTFARLLQLLDVFAAARYNAILVEWEDMFPWTVDLRFRCETAYTPEQVRQLNATARARGLEIIPLVQCLGHMETPLSTPGYESLREVADEADGLNPLAKGARELVRKMMDDVLTLLPDVRYFHLGGDEVWSFGTHPDTKAYIAQHGKGALYLHHVEPLLDQLLAQGIRPMLWHDMMIKWDSAMLQRLSTKADLVVWGYNGHPDQVTHHFSSQHIQRFKEYGLTLWSAGAYKGADGSDCDVPRFAERQSNALAWTELARRYEMVGLIATGWSRYSTHNVQNEPIDAALDSLVNLGRIFHDGIAFPSGRNDCLKFLETLDERRCYEACYNALRRFQQARDMSWLNNRCARHCIAVAAHDPRRSMGWNVQRFMRWFRKDVALAEDAALEVRRVFQSLIEPIWIERYLAERIEPLREELDDLESRAMGHLHGSQTEFHGDSRLQRSFASKDL